MEEFLTSIKHCSLTLDELSTAYCTYGYAVTGSYAETARRLMIDRRTVRARTDAHWLRQFGGKLDPNDDGYEQP